MANQNGAKYGFTGIFPILPGQAAELRVFLRSLDDTAIYPGGSPFSHVSIVHMARLFIIDRLAYQGTPAKADTLESAYLVFMCDFDGDGVDGLARGLMQGISVETTEIWKHCVSFPGVHQYDLLAEYFERCQISTTLFFADQPVATVGDILKGLLCRRALGEFVKQAQHRPRNPAVLKRGFLRMWRRLQRQTPAPGSL
jgi:hypothetical protein